MQMYQQSTQASQARISSYCFPPFLCNDKTVRNLTVGVLENHSRYMTRWFFAMHYNHRHPETGAIKSMQNIIKSKD